MSFSSDVKDYLQTAHDDARDCCKEAFDLAQKGERAPLICKRCGMYYMAGVFCEFGTMGDPSKGYQLFIYPPKETEEFIYSILDEEVTPKRGSNKGRRCFYYKTADEVAGFLTYCKAPSFALKVLEEVVEREEKARLQRFCNAEIANMDRTSTAAAEQLAAIKTLRKNHMIDNIKKEYREAALLREAYPETGLEELARLSPTPISKSGLNYRLKKLVSMASELKMDDAP